MSDQELFTIDVCLKLPVQLADALKEVVVATGMSQEELITHYVIEGVAHAMPKVKRELFFSHTKEILKKHNVPADAVEEIVDKFVF